MVGEKEDLSVGQPRKLCSPNTLGAMNTLQRQSFHLVLKQRSDAMSDKH